MTNGGYLSLQASSIAPLTSATPVVFVVDDDASVRRSLEMLIRRAGYQARTFASAREFLACERTSAPGCLVLEVTLPDLNGFELLEGIDGGDGMPTIFI